MARAFDNIRRIFEGLPAHPSILESGSGAKAEILYNVHTRKVDVVYKFDSIYYESGLFNWEAFAGNAVTILLSSVYLLFFIFYWYSVFSYFKTKQSHWGWAFKFPQNYLLVAFPGLLFMAAFYKTLIWPALIIDYFGVLGWNIFCLFTLPFDITMFF